ncbi:MAG: hypothetical protein AABY22_17755, partial [Nanoarchaeota archaeon]
SERNKILHKGNKYRLGQKQTEVTKEKIRKKLFQRAKTFKDTSIEIKIHDCLNKLGILYQKHTVIENFVICDIFIEPNTVIFVDGCYFHACPICYPDRTKLNSTQNKQIIRDTLVNQFFSNLDKYKIFRFWEHEINKNEMLEKIRNYIKNEVII